MIVSIQKLREIVDNIPAELNDCTVKLEGCDCYGEMGDNEDYNAPYSVDLKDRVVYLHRESDPNTLEAARHEQDFRRRKEAK